MELPLKHPFLSRMFANSALLSDRIGGNSVRLRWTPKEQSGNKFRFRAASLTAGPLASIVADVMFPACMPLNIASFTASLIPRSSAFTMIFIDIGRWNWPQPICRVYYRSNCELEYQD